LPSYHPGLSVFWRDDLGHSFTGRYVRDVATGPVVDSAEGLLEAATIFAAAARDAGVELVVTSNSV